MNTERNCFCELAPLYALDALSEAERDWVEQQLAADPDLGEELAMYELAVAALPYSAPPAPMATDLKVRLFDRLNLQRAPGLSNDASDGLSEAAPADYRAIRAQDLNWQPHRVPGVMVAIVHTDAIKREIVGFLRAEPGVRYPLHRHAAIEELFMLEGDLVIGEEVYGAGDYIRSNPGSRHAPHTAGGCRFFFHTSLDDEFLDESSA